MDSGLVSNTLPIEITHKPILSSFYSKQVKVGESLGVCGVGFDSNSVVVFDGAIGNQIKPFNRASVCMAFRVPSSVSVGSHAVQIMQIDTGDVSNSLPLMVVAGTSSPSVISTSTTSAQPTQAPLVPTGPVVQTPTQTNAATALQQQLVQLITTLLQLVQQAVTQGLLTSSQVLSILNSIPAIH
jgi:hypothetical protein